MGTRKHSVKRHPTLSLQKTSGDVQHNDTILKKIKCIKINTKIKKTIIKCNGRHTIL